MKSARPRAKKHVSTRTEAAERIAIDASRLARMAKANDFPLIAYLIEMAVLEAWREAGEHIADSPEEDTQPATSG